MTNQNDSVDTDIEFSLSKYFESLENKIQGILSRPEKKCVDIRYFRYREIKNQ